MHNAYCIIAEINFAKLNIIYSYWPYTDWLPLYAAAAWSVAHWANGWTEEEEKEK
jgi:hypothetical protein